VGALIDRGLKRRDYVHTYAYVKCRFEGGKPLDVQQHGTLARCNAIVDAAVSLCTRVLFLGLWGYAAGLRDHRNRENTNKT
jgi:hypothetical protein